MFPKPVPKVTQESNKGSCCFLQGQPADTTTRYVLKKAEGMGKAA